MKVSGTRTSVEEVVINVDIDDLREQLIMKLHELYPTVSPDYLYEGDKVYSSIHYDEELRCLQKRYIRESTLDEQKYEEYHLLLNRLLSR